MPVLTTIRARDIMKTDVVVLDPRTPIEQAIEMLEENDISGAPVVDGSGRLLGILTARDVTRSEHVRSGRIETNRGEFAMSGPVDEEGENDEGEQVIFDKEDYSPPLAGVETVADWMNRRVVTVDVDAPLKDVCRAMLKESVHRAIVARERKVLGIITSLDIVRWVAEQR